MTGARAIIQYSPRIDGLRAVAVILVVFSHWLPPTSLVNLMPNGQIGVDLFFAISGFLITSILLSFRRAIEGGRSGRAGALGSFYVRRTLRLFPLYYAVLAIVLLLPDVTATGIHADWPWFVTFMQNFLMAGRGTWSGFLSHFWSLAVEEQYYLLWGLAVIAAPREYIARLAWVGVAVGLVTRAGGVLTARDSAFFHLITPACVDGLALGSLAALWNERQPDKRAALKRFAAWGPWVCIGIALSGRLIPGLWDTLGVSAVALAGVHGIYWALDGAKARSPLGKGLEWRPFAEFGRRSYGLYVFHNLVPYGWTSVRSLLVSRHVMPRSAERLFEYPWELIPWTVLLIVLAYASWQFFERPINGLKNRFAP